MWTKYSKTTIFVLKTILVHIVQILVHMDCFSPRLSTLPRVKSPDEYMSQVMFGRPIMMFTCFFVPVGGDARLDKFKRNFVFFSAFEDLELDSEAGSPGQCNACLTSKCCMSLDLGILKGHLSWNHFSTLPPLRIFYVECH